MEFCKSLTSVPDSSRRPVQNDYPVARDTGIHLQENPVAVKGRFLFNLHTVPNSSVSSVGLLFRYPTVLKDLSEIDILFYQTHAHPTEHRFWILYCRERITPWIIDCTIKFILRAEWDLFPTGIDAIIYTVRGTLLDSVVYRHDPVSGTERAMWMLIIFAVQRERTLHSKIHFQMLFRELRK